MALSHFALIPKDVWLRLMVFIRKSVNLGSIIDMRIFMLDCLLSSGKILSKVT